MVFKYYWLVRRAICNHRNVPTAKSHARRKRWADSVLRNCRMNLVAFQNHRLCRAFFLNVVCYRVAVDRVYCKRNIFSYTHPVLFCCSIDCVPTDAEAPFSHHSIISNRAVCSKSGNFFPRLDARVRMP